MGIYRFIKEKQEWIRIEEKDKQDTDIFISNRLKTCLDHFKAEQKKDSDIVIVIFGKEGSGKSAIQGTILEYISNTEFNPKTDLIGADYLDGLRKIENVKQSGWLGFDEGNAFFLSTETMNREHRDLHKIFSIFRQKNLFIIICLPSFLRLGSYFALDRTSSAIKTYKKEGKRGFFAFYGRSAKDKLYRVGKINYDDNIIQADFRAKFSKCYKLETDEYKNFKKQTLKREIAKAVAKFEKRERSSSKIAPYSTKEVVRNNMEKPIKELSEMLKLSEPRIKQLKTEIRRESIAK